MRKCFYLPVHRSTQRQGDKRSAAADLIASNAPLREGRHTARQNGPKHYSGDPMGAAAPLVCLSPLSFFKQRKMVPPEVVGLVERLVKKRTAKDIATGGRSEKRMPVKTQNQNAKKEPPLGSSFPSYHNLSIQNLHRRLHHLRPGIHTPFLNKSVRLFLGHAVSAHQ